MLKQKSSVHDDIKQTKADAEWKMDYKIRILCTNNKKEYVLKKDSSSKGNKAQEFNQEHPLPVWPGWMEI